MVFLVISSSPLYVLTFLSGAIFISRANEGFKRSIYAGIPSLDSSYPPGYFKGLCTTFVASG
ncbi:hypothetical protein B9T16_24745 [Arthrospira sp. PCC 8006]